jgi:hypothetical protein
MGKNWERFKFILEWIEHGRLAAEIVGSFAAGKTLKAVLATYTSIPPIWITPIWLSFAAIVLYLLIWIGRRGKSQQKQALQSATNALVTSPVTFDANAFFIQAYASTLLQETEQRIRTMVDQNQPPDREAFYLKFIATGIIGYLYDIAWAYIYRSQILLLMELNRRVLTIAEARTYYDRAANDNQAAYSNYSFEQWLEFMKTHVLLFEHASGMVEITPRGKDFLKYLVHWGRYPDDRKL